MQGKTNHPQEDVGDGHQVEDALIETVCYTATAIPAGFSNGFAHSTLRIRWQAETYKKEKYKDT